jgi:hypothetical protein
LLEFFVVAWLYTDHVVGAAVADLRADTTDVDTVLDMVSHCSVVLMHKPPWGYFIGNHMLKGKS